MLQVVLNVPSDLDHLKRGLKQLSAFLPSELTGRITATWSEQPGLTAAAHTEGYQLQFNRACELFRGIGLIAAGSVLPDGSMAQQLPFRSLGVMYDCSRNSVPTVATVKQILSRMALMGYNVLMLYTEDTYTLASRPEFGHYRGRYSPTELKEIDDFAWQLGIEMIPCIQTLAHLERFLRWQSTDSLRDNQHILLSENAAVYSLIDEMITSVSSCVRSRRIHLGLDEAHGLGLGRYLEQNGYRRPEKIMQTHLEAVGQICSRHALKPMMWGDMIFRMNIAGAGYYDQDVVLPAGTGDIIPKSYDVVYWDYYHTEEAFYEKYIDEHLKQGIKPLFAAGVCSWIGMVPNLVRTAATTRSSVQAALKKQLDDMFLCVWKDDGGEGLPGPDFLGMMMYAEYCYNQGQQDLPAWRRQAPVMTGASYDSFMAVGSIDEIQEGLSLAGLEAPNPHKYFLWQDILLGQFDCEAATGDYAAVYTRKAGELAALLSAGEYQPEALYGLRLGYLLCRLLAYKVDLGVRLKSAYDSGDQVKLAELRELIAGEYPQRIRELRDWHRDSWFHFYKPFGWEIADLKYNHLLGRAETACYRLDAYLRGEISQIDELAQDRLTSVGRVPAGPVNLPHFNNFLNAATVGQI
ncbi:MAG TPA: beta-N-acetylhexosaminidase [Clostridiales bacterium]|nr:beta-N-acetylhexosaminidase [Clostridiales bacterium]